MKQLIRFEIPQFIHWSFRQPSLNLFNRLIFILSIKWKLTYPHLTASHPLLFFCLNENLIISKSRMFLDGNKCYTDVHGGGGVYIWVFLVKVGQILYVVENEIGFIINVLLSIRFDLWETILYWMIGFNFIYLANTRPGGGIARQNHESPFNLNT